MIGGGLAVFSAGYAVTLAVSLLVGQWGGTVPLIGPIIFAAQALEQNAHFPERKPLDLLIASAASLEVAAQVAGIALIMAGVGSPRKWLERGEAPTVSFVPSAVGAPLGATLVGRF